MKGDSMKVLDFCKIFINKNMSVGTLTDIPGHDIDSGLKFTTDGNLQLTESGTGHVLWTNGVNGGEMLILQNNGNLVMYDIQERYIWQTNTELSYCAEGN